ncbi:MAG: universal stress protein [Phototrophicaceae bacterium]
MSESRYKKIIVPIDGSGWSERAIPHAVDIAQSNEAEIILLHVFKPPANEYVGDIALAGQDESLMAVREDMKAKLMALRGQIRSEKVDVRVQFIEGTGVAGIICDYINEEDADLVVMSSHGRTGVTRWLFGSVAHKVMQGVDVPVMIIRPDKD